MRMLRRNDKTTLRAFRAGLLAFALSAYGASSVHEAQAQTPIPVTLAGTPLGVHSIPEFIAVKLGFFKAVGIDLKRQQFAGGSDAMNAMVSGSADVGSAFFENTINLALRGRQIKTFVSGQTLGGLVLVSGPGSDITRISQLAGKRVGVTAPGSGTDFLLRYLLRKAGLKADDVSIVGVGLGDTAVVAIEQRLVQAVVTIEPTVAQLEARNPGQVHVLVDTRTPKDAQAVYGAPYYPGQGLMARAEWLQKNPEAARRVAAAMIKSLQWVHSHSAEEILAELPDGKFGALPRDVALKAIKAAIPTYSTDGRMTRQAAQIVYSVFSDADPKYAEAKINVDDLYTNEYLPK